MNGTSDPVDSAKYGQADEGCNSPRELASLTLHRAADTVAGEAIANRLRGVIHGRFLLLHSHVEHMPGIYAKYFGLPLTAIAVVILSLRLFDGAIITAIGYLSDWHRTAGGSRKTWIAVGTIGVVVACYFPFQPPQPATSTYYPLWSLVYFLAYAVVDVPHVTWGNELTLDYQERAKNLRCPQDHDERGLRRLLRAPIVANVFLNCVHTASVEGCAVHRRPYVRLRCDVGTTSGICWNHCPDRSRG